MPKAGPSVWFLKCDPGPGSMSLAWEAVRMQAPRPQTCLIRPAFSQLLRGAVGAASSGATGWRTEQMPPLRPRGRAWRAEAPGEEGSPHSGWSWPVPVCHVHGDTSTDVEMGVGKPPLQVNIAAAPKLAFCACLFVLISFSSLLRFIKK